MHIFVDADACPVVGIVEKVAKEHSKAETAKRNAWPPQIKYWRSQLILLPVSCGRVL